MGDQNRVIKKLYKINLFITRPRQIVFIQAKIALLFLQDCC